MSAVCRHAAADNSEELAKKLANPVATMISIPIQFNYDEHYGSGSDGTKRTTNIQPVVPIKLNPDWNLISRTILPVTSQDGVAPGGGSQNGLGDITQSLFFSPAKNTGGLIWGAGPVFLLPTGTDPMLSARQWGAGPTAVVVKQEGAWTYGMLANHIWSFGGSGPTTVNSTFLQPFVSHTTKAAWTFSANAESTYDWNGSGWSVPINLTAAKLMKFGKQPVQIGGGLRYWAEGPDSGPHDWGLRLVVTFLIPE